MKLTVVGVMSGTSYDAVDAAVAEFDLAGDEIGCRPLGLHTVEWPSALRARLAAILPPNPTSIDEVTRLDAEIGQLFGTVAARANDLLAHGRADLVASHGQTVFHWVEAGHARGTLQLGAAAWLAEATGLPTVTDLRTRDITRGGQGAPLASTLDALLVLDDTGVRRGALNLGGIANISVRGDDGQVLAYDLGPANALIDGVVSTASGGQERMDVGGARAARGTVDTGVLDLLLAEPYYALPAPKSTGKERFGAHYLAGRGIVSTPDLDDLVATLTDLTAHLVAQACRRHRLDELVVSGGSVANGTLMRRIADLAAPARVRPIDDFGLPAQAKEAYLVALLGYLCVHGLPGSIASATGARTGSVLGSITPGTGPLRLPEPVAAAPTRLRIR